MFCVARIPIFSYEYACALTRTPSFWYTVSSMDNTNLFGSILLMFVMGAGFGFYLTKLFVGI
jgi:hypothetical protein